MKMLPNNSLFCRIFSAFFALSLASVAHANFSWSGGSEGDWTAAGNWTGSFAPGAPAYWIASPPEDSFPGQSAANLLADPNTYVSFQLSDFGPDPHDVSYSDLAEYQTAYNAHFGSLPNPSIYNASSFGPNPNDAEFTTLAEYRTAFPEATYNSNYTSAQSSVVTNISNIIIPAVTFASDGSTTVNFNSNISTTALTLQPGSTQRTIQFNLDGRELSTGQLSPGTWGDQELIVNGGVLEVTESIRIGSGSDSTESTVTLQNGAALRSTNSANTTANVSYLGDSGNFTMEISGGSLFRAGHIFHIGRNAGTEAHVTVSGVGSQLISGQSNAAGNATIASNGGDATVIIENGGYMTSGRRFYLGDGGNALVIVRGSGLDAENNVVPSTFTSSAGVNSGIFLGGTTSAAFSSGNAHVIVEEGGLMITQRNIVVYGGSTLEVNRGNVTLTSGTTHNAYPTAAYLFPNANLVYWLYSDSSTALVNITGNIGGAAITITDAILDIRLDDGFTANIGDPFPLLRYSSSVVGEFAGMAQGSTFTIDGYTFQIDYAMVSGADTVIGLTVVPEPAMIGTLLGLICLGTTLSIRRRHKKTCLH